MILGKLADELQISFDFLGGFVEKAEETLKKRGSIDFSKQRAEMKAMLSNNTL